MSRKGNSQKKNEYKTLLSVIAFGATDKACDQLEKLTGETAENERELQVKLGRAYAQSTDKRAIEKQWAEMHPHKEFILKYTKPVEELGALKPDMVVKSVTDENQPTIVKNTVIHDGYSNCEGNPDCNCNKMSNACGCSHSSFNGSNASGVIDQPVNSDKTALVVSVIALFGLLAYLKSTK